MSHEFTTNFSELTPAEQQIIAHARTFEPTGATVTITLAGYDGGPETKLFSGADAQARDLVNTYMGDPKHLFKVLIVYVNGSRFATRVTKKSAARSRQWHTLVSQGKS